MAKAPPPPLPAGEADPSMDDILASIRRILSDEEKAAGKGPSDGVLMLDPSMVVEDGTAAADRANANPSAAPGARSMQETSSPSQPHASESASDAHPDHAAETQPAPAFMHDADHQPTRPDALVAPAAAAAASASVGTLMRTLVAERNAVVHRGGPSIEDLVREEIRPLLKGWLDEHLPGLVERLVRAEIERVVGRITG